MIEAFDSLSLLSFRALCAPQRSRCNSIAGFTHRSLVSGCACKAKAVVVVAKCHERFKRGEGAWPVLN